MLELIPVAKEGIELVKAVTSDRKSANPRLDRLDDEIVAALREIYFTPEGVKSLLREVAEGKTPEVQKVERVLPNFNDSEWRVGRALALLNYENLSDRREVSLRRAETLNQLRFGKINLRRDIQTLLNRSLTVGQAIAPDEARELLDRVSALNAEIVELEEAHNYRARR